MVRKRCGCGTSCSCSFVSGEGATVSGGPETGFVVTGGEGNTEVTVLDTPTMDMHITGTGTPADPYAITADRTASPVTGVGSSWATFHGDGVWQKPNGFQTGFALIVCIGGGGGGGGGGATSAANTPGFGGGGGGFSQRLIKVSDLPASVPVSVGIGGAGGEVSNSAPANGKRGEDGGASVFGTFLHAGGGQGGGAGGATLALATGGAGTERGGTGGRARAVAPPAETIQLQASGNAGSGGGGAGLGDISGSPSVPNKSGMDGGIVYGNGAYGIGLGAVWAGVSPATDAVARPDTDTNTPGGTWPTGGAGGGGGQGGGTNATRSSGAAGIEGGGGGGGGSGRNNTGASGGPGGDGKVYVICWQTT